MVTTWGSPRDAPSGGEGNESPEIGGPPRSPPPPADAFGGAGGSGCLQNLSRDSPATPTCVVWSPPLMPMAMGRVAGLVNSEAPADPSGHLQPPCLRHSASGP